MNRLLRTAILGSGGFAHRHAQTLQVLRDDFEMVAFCNRTIEKARKFSDSYTSGQAPAFSDQHEIFEQVPLDVVLISLPPYAPSDAGPVGLMSARYFCNSLHTPWWRRRDLSGGQLVEQVIHMVDLMRFLMGDALTVYSRQENIFHQEVEDYTVEDVSATIFSFPKGGIGVIYATNGAIPNRWINDYRVVAKNLTVEFTDANHATFHHTTETNRPPEVIASDRDVYLAEMQDFLNAIRTGEKSRVPLRDGAKSLDLALAATRSAQSGGELQMPETR